MQQLLAAAGGDHLARLRAVLAVRPDLVAARTWAPASPDDVASGYSALHFAAAGDNVECLAALLAAGADVRARDDRGATALHWCAAAVASLDHEGSCGLCLRALIAAGADVDARDEDGETALHCAARLGNLAAIRCLAEAGAYLGAANLEGESPQIVARNHCKWEAAVLLGQLQAELDGALVQEGATGACICFVVLPLLGVPCWPAGQQQLAFVCMASPPPRPPPTCRCPRGGVCGRRVAEVHPPRGGTASSQPERPAGYLSPRCCMALAACPLLCIHNISEHSCFCPDSIRYLLLYPCTLHFFMPPRY